MKRRRKEKSMRKISSKCPQKRKKRSYALFVWHGVRVWPFVGMQHIANFVVILSVVVRRLTGHTPTS
jgi:hypothetical protein